MDKIAFVFAGQGAQKPGMGLSLYEQSPAARQVFDRAEQQSKGLLDLCFQGPMDKLTQTRYAQPALFACGLAAAAAAGEQGLRAQACAGFSLGEWAACADAGMMDFETALSLVLKRGEAMQACALKHPGAMAAVLRIPGEAVQALCKDHPGVYAVNFNCPGQTVIASTEEAFPAFEQAVKANGGRCMRLAVSGAFHSPYMQEAADQMAAAMADVNIVAAKIPVYGNTLAIPYEADLAKELLVKQITHPVLWEKTLLRMAEDGIQGFIEMGPGTVLSGLIAKTLPSLPCAHVEDAASLADAVQKFGGQRP